MRCPSQFRGTPDCNESVALHNYGLNCSLLLSVLQTFDRFFTYIWTLLRRKVVEWWRRFAQKYCCGALRIPDKDPRLGLRDRTRRLSHVLLRKDVSMRAGSMYAASLERIRDRSRVLTR